MTPLVDMFRGGDPRKLHGVAQAVDQLLEDPSRIEELMSALAHDDAVVRMRAADTAEKIGRSRPEYLQPFKRTLLQLAQTTQQSSVRWHAAQILPRLRLERDERAAAVALLKRYLGDPSALVKTCAMQGLAGFADADPTIRPAVIRVLRRATVTGTAAMRARGTRLLRFLKSDRPVR